LHGTDVWDSRAAIALVEHGTPYLPFIPFTWIACE